MMKPECRLQYVYLMHFYDLVNEHCVTVLHNLTDERHRMNKCYYIALNV